LDAARDNLTLVLAVPYDVQHVPRREQMAMKKKKKVVKRTVRKAKKGGKRKAKR
jgi:hypothetical protein